MSRIPGIKKVPGQSTEHLPRMWEPECLTDYFLALEKAFREGIDPVFPGYIFSVVMASTLVAGHNNSIDRNKVTVCYKFGLHRRLRPAAIRSLSAIEKRVNGGPIITQEYQQWQKEQ